MKYKIMIHYNHSTTTAGFGIPPSIAILSKTYNNIFEAKAYKPELIKHNYGCSFTIVKIEE